MFHNAVLATMNALRAHARGGPKQLVYEEAPRPEPGQADALVQVFAAAITPMELGWDSTWTDHRGASRLPIIHGGAGGVGSFAVQLARWVGAEVIATASAADGRLRPRPRRRSSPRLPSRALRGRHVVCRRGPRHSRRTDPRAIVEGDRPGWNGGFHRRVSSNRNAAERRATGLVFTVERNREQLKYLARLADDGKLHPIVSAVFPLSRGQEAFEFALMQHVRGKVVLTVEP